MTENFESGEKPKHFTEDEVRKMRDLGNKV